MGLLEVLVALILLAIGVLGYVALQLRAMDASSEALSKSQAILVMRGLAENIRTNSTQASQYPTFVRSYSNYTSDTPAPTSCFNSLCTASQLAQFDAYQAARNANQLGMKLRCQIALALQIQWCNNASAYLSFGVELRQ